MRFAWLGAGAALSFIVAAGCSTSTDRAEKIGAAKQGIQGGDPDTTHTYAVGVTSDGNSVCSGALIAPNVVVTARHCVQSIDYKNPPTPKTIDCKLGPTFTGGIRNPMYITTKSNIFDQTGYRKGQAVVNTASNSVCNNDIALIVLDNLVPAATATPIIPGVQYAVNYSKYLSSFTAIGYGGADANGTGLGTRRIRQLIRIQCIPGDENVPCPATADFPENEFVAGDGPCGGDSGSSAYEQGSFTFATPVSLGVLSRGSEDGTTCIGSVYTRLDKFRDLIINTVKAASNNWTLYPEPSWTAYVPPEVKDAGTASPDAGKPTTTPTPGQFGETCSDNSECKSKLCGSEGACTTACEDSSTCPEGYDCTNSQCLTAAAAPADSAAPTTTTTTTDGCNTSGSSTSWGTIALAGIAAIAIGGRRRRRT